MPDKDRSQREASRAFTDARYDGVAIEPEAAPDCISGASFLVLTNYYEPEPTGSAPPITDLCRWLAAENADVSVVTTRPSYPARRVFPGYIAGERDSETLSGVHVRRLPTLVLVTSGMVSRLIGEASFALSALFHAATQSPIPSRYIIAVCPSILTVIVANSFRAEGGRLTAIVHDVQSGLAQALDFPGAIGISKRLAKLEAWALNRCDSIITLSSDMEQVLRRQGVMCPIEVIPPQVDVSEFQDSRRPLGAPPLILYSGNFGRKQGLGQLVELAGVLAARGVEGRVVLRGAGSEREALDKAISARGLTNIILEPLSPRASCRSASQRVLSTSCRRIPEAPTSQCQARSSP